MLRWHFNGLWPFNDLDMNDLLPTKCKTFFFSLKYFSLTLAVMQTVYDGHTVYNSPFCYICNNPKGSLAITDCKKRPHGLDIDPALGPVYDLETGSSKLLYSWKLIINDSSCADATFYDPFLVR